MISQELPCVEYLRQCLSYNPEDGKLTWKKRPEHLFATPIRAKAWNTKNSGKQAGFKCNGYISIKLEGRCHKAHRIAWALFHGEWPDKILDHINGDKSDNRACNLRKSSAMENARNAKIYKTNTSGRVGVTWNKSKNRWQATIFDNGKIRHLGRFSSLSAAVQARSKAEAELGYSERHGEKYHG